MADGLKQYHFLDGKGEMATLTRAFDWSSTPIGPIETWSAALKTIVGVILHSEFPMFLWWGDEMTQFYNDAYRPSLGQEGKHPTALGQRGVDCWPEIWAIIHPLIIQVKTTNESFFLEDQLIPIFRNGKIEDVYWTFSYSSVIGESGNIDGVLVVCTETTKNFQNVRALGESEQRFRTMAENTDILIALSDETTNATYFNKAWSLFTGRSEKDLLNFGWADLIHEEDRQTFVNLYLDSFATREAWSAEMRMLNSEGEYRWLLATGPPRFRPDGSFAGYISTAVDITEHKNEERRFEDLVIERTESLRRSNAELSQFAYITSHDLQEPARKISTFTEILTRSLGNTIDERSKGYLGKIEASAKRMLVLIRDILTLSQLSGVAYPFGKVDLNKILEEVKSDFELLIEQKHCKIGNDKLPVVDAIPIQMSQLFSNLLSNALKFSKPNNSMCLDIKCERVAPEQAREFMLSADKSYYKITFADNGIGFDQEYSKKIFEIFQRLHEKTEYQGTGIGLAMCKKIAENHGGTIYAVSKPGEGSSFIVLLPESQS